MPSAATPTAKGDSSGFFRTAGDGRTVPGPLPRRLPAHDHHRADGRLARRGYRATITERLALRPRRQHGANEFGFREENTVNVS